jgi:phosphatidylserine/phosphatidylglycerophosphate/cardiolipin synthase-like enzyme
MTDGPIPTPAACSYPARDGNFVQPLVDGVPAFTLAGLAGRDGRGPRHDAYVHDKLMLVDDAWATIGSANLHHNSLLGSGEMNASIWDPAVVRALRVHLFQEHLGRETATYGA